MNNPEINKPVKLTIKSLALINLLLSFKLQWKLDGFPGTILKNIIYV